MPKPVCVACQCFYRPKHNGYYFTEMMPRGYDEGPPEQRRGKRAPETWEPYKIWSSDMYECPECGHQILVGFSHRPVSEHYMSDFGEISVALAADQLKVNDC